ncbi:spore germination protein (amino acid permease) [Paenibacillus cellulosilyticus]|uniref:Spore germination protein (Amino acid permease) n=1 Tax=Paenibacillus cellulosilyticus TaxID=375489 RepID=A0A2V2YQ37_9BACL|nr:endospore germination permease [Paenibacillus cellulosilyticus]PWV98565.1 spore germination protein (amino acid permease) [Paenibacillus cellulosilyticus]QKS44169.1 endospore germination permease [Paenibacillus cellulosilyticus]
MKIQISNGMFIAMILNIMYAKAIGVTQGVLARAVGQDMWLATLLGTLEGIVMMYLTYVVIRRTPDKDFVQLGQLLLGRWFSSLIALVIFAFFIVAFGPIMITFVYHLRDYFLPDAPLWIFVVTSLVVGAIGCYYGLEVMGRIAMIGLLFMFALNVLITIGSMQEFDIRNLLPVMESGLPRTAKASMHYLADCAMATMMATLVLPLVKKVDIGNGRFGVLGIIGSGMMIIIWAILEGAVLSSEVTSQYTLSCMKLARNAHIGTFLQRYEMIMIALYSLPALFEVMFCIYGTSVCISRIFGIKSNRPMIIPCCIVLGVFGYWIIEDHFRAIDFLENYWPFIALPVAIGLPLIMVLLRVMLGSKLQKKSA